MKYYFTLVALLFLLLSCDNAGFKDLDEADWYITDYLIYVNNVNTNYVYHDAIENERIISISTSAELDPFVSYLPGLTIGLQSFESAFSGTDFSSYKLFALKLIYQASDTGEMKKTNILVNDKKQQVKFDFRWRVPVGSGMGQISQIILFRVPKTYDNYEFSGTIKIDEHGIGYNPKDKLKEYGLY